MERHCWKICALFLVLLTGTISAQTILNDNVYTKENYNNKRVIPYAPLREADVMWEKVVWEYIDLREKKNLPLFYPTEPVPDRKSLWDVISKEVTPDTSKGMNNLQPGKLMAFQMNLNDFNSGFIYKDARDSLLQPLRDLLVNKLCYSYDQLKNAAGQDVPQPYLSEDIVGYIIKEDWFFDRQRSVMDVRILGIAPVTVFRDATTGVPSQDQAPIPQFWIYYPQARQYFANVEVYNPNNDAERRTLEDIIWKRQFSSYIIQVSNVYSRKIKDYQSGIDAQLEAEKIKAKMFEFEHDMWEY